MVVIHGGSYVFDVIFFFFIILLIITLITKNSSNSKGTILRGNNITYRRESNGYTRSTARSHAVAEKIRQIDPQFNEEKFISNAKELFVKLQNAWSNRNLEELRPLISEAMFEQYSNSIKNYIDRKQINKLERICTNYGELVSFMQDNEKDTLTVAINSTMIDYIINEENGKILKGDKDRRITKTYKMVYTRKKGILTEEGTDEVKTTNCPNCGAPTQITSSGRCEYCNSVITTGSHDWVLTNIEVF